MRVLVILSVALISLSAAVGCFLRPPFVIVNVVDPEGLAGGASVLVARANGSDDRVLPIEAGVLVEGQPLTLLARGPGARIVRIEARDSAGTVLGRVVVNVEFSSLDQPQVPARLGLPCDSAADQEVDAQCTAVPGCGLGRCGNDGVCACGACGDGRVDQGEQCDDGADDNPNDNCYGCRQVEWEPEILIGLASGPLEIPFDSVVGIAVDQDGNVFFAATDLDQAQVVWRIDATTGYATRYAGGGERSLADGTVDAVATTLQLEIADLRVDGLGDVYIATPNSVLRIDRVGRAQIVAGGATCGTRWSEVNIPLEGLPARAACFDFAAGVAIDGNGDVFVADTLGHAVYRIDSGTGILTIHAGTRLPGQPQSSQEGGPSSLFPLTAPTGLALDNQGRLYVVTEAETSASSAVRVVENGTARTLVGNIAGDPIRDLDVRGRGQVVFANGRGLSAVSIDGLVTALEVVEPGWPYTNFDATAVAVDAFDNIFFFHADRRELSKFDGGQTIHLAGSENRLPCCDGVPGTAAKLGGPEDLARSPNGDVYITSRLERRVRRLDNNWRIDTLIGTGLGGSPQLDEPLRNQRIQTPRSVTTDSLGRVYIAMARNSGQGFPEIWRIDEERGTVEVLGGSVIGRSLLAEFEHAGAVTDLVVDRNEILYIDEANDLVRALDLDTGLSTTVVGVFGAENAQENQPLGTWLWDPSDLAIDESGRVVVADRGGGVLYRVDRSLQTLCVLVADFGHPGERCLDSGDVVIPDFSPQAVAIDALGTLWVATAGTVFSLSPDGALTSVFGQGAGGMSGDGGPAEAATFFGISDLLVDDKGLTLLDGDRVRRIEDGLITTVAGPVNLGDGPLGKARLQNPKAMVRRSEVEWLIADGNAGRVRSLDFINARLRTVVGYPGGAGEEETLGGLAFYRELLAGASGLAIDEDYGLLFVSESDNNVIHRIAMTPAASPQAWTTTPFVGHSGEEGTSNGARAEATLSSPQGLAFDAETGVLFVADSGSHTVRAVQTRSSGTSAVRIVLGTAGQRGIIADGVRAQDAFLNVPVAVATAHDASGVLVLFVADQANHRVLRVTDPLREDAISNLVLGDGAASSSGEGAAARLSSVESPAGLALDRHGNLYVSSTNTVRQVVAGADGLAGGGDAAYTIYGRPPRTRFPEPVTHCLTDLDTQHLLGNATRIMVLDACQGFVVSLLRNQLLTEADANGASRD